MEYLRNKLIIIVIFLPIVSAIFPQIMHPGIQPRKNAAVKIPVYVPISDGSIYIVKRIRDCYIGNVKPNQKWSVWHDGITEHGPNKSKKHRTQQCTQVKTFLNVVSHIYSIYIRKMNIAYIFKRNVNRNCI